ncbi:MAG: type II toxin-antitoxin system death-on-curing family toxin [Pseudomonadota bacterium]
MSQPKWLRLEALLILHEEGLAEHGGLAGIRDQGLLESALESPKNKAYYEPESDMFVLAATYSHAIAKNHPFFDGNKRAAFLAAATFLAVNGFSLEAGEADATLKVLALAASEIDIADFAAWLRESSDEI